MQESIFLKIEDNEENLEKIVRYNLAQAQKIRKELKLLEEMTQIPEVSVVEEEATEELSMETPIIEEEYQYYFENLMQDLKKAKTIFEKQEVVFRNLPSVENKNYVNIVNRIKLELVHEIQELATLKEEETDLDFLREIETEQQSIQLILDFIKEAQTTKIEAQIATSAKIENKLLFLKTSSGSIYVENDLYGHEEYFDSFKELLLSIENGTFKNVKRFENNLQMKGICQVKKFKTRIIFDRLDKDKYVIIDAIIKKTDNDNGYRDQVGTRILYYKNNKDTMISQMNDEDYLRKNKKIRDNLIIGLADKKLIKTVKNEEGGASNAFLR